MIELKQKYQELDRLNYPTTTADQYMMPNNSTSMDHYRGYIFGVDNNNPAGFSSSPSGTFSFNASKPVLVGAPFFFYFGLKKGKSAFNRFSTKWIEGETV